MRDIWIASDKHVTKNIQSTCVFTNMLKHEGALYKEASLASQWLICQSPLTSADQIQYGGRLHDKKGK